MATRSNPMAAAEAAYRDFHGHDAEEIFDFEQPANFHSVLAGCGRLVELIIRSLDGDVIGLSDFGGGLLAMNGKRTQLYFRGVDRKLDLRQFGIDRRRPHDLELLGYWRSVTYDTNKTHLRPEDGGKANYRHQFGGSGKRLPMITYDTMNDLLAVVGGDYEISPEGIVY